jgi:hypothetical protein
VTISTSLDFVELWHVACGGTVEAAATLLNRSGGGGGIAVIIFKKPKADSETDFEATI